MKINIDVKDPIISSILVIIITSLITSVILLVTKPSYIMEISKSGQKKIKVSLLISISLLLGLFLGAIKIIFSSIKSSTPEIKTPESKTPKKNYFMFDPNKYNSDSLKIRESG